MTNCSCVAVYVEDGPDEWNEEMRVAGTEHKCVECRRTIELGEEYELSWGEYFDDDGDVIESESTKEYTVCIDCTSMRRAFFCEGWYIGRTWNTLGDHLAEVVQFGNGVSSECMMQLTKSARDDVCDIIEDIWSDEEEEEAA